MIMTTTYTTKRLEQYARSLGMQFGIAYVDQNAGGRYFVISEQGEPLSVWKRLGWTAEDARYQLQQEAYYQGAR